MGKIKLDKKDSLRALLTDTYPGETPIIYSNDGLYANSHKRRLAKKPPIILTSIFTNLLEASNRGFIPYKYCIKKDDFSLRQLSLIHPASQIRFCALYENYSDKIIYLCSKSKFSIRAPSRVSASYYSRDTDHSENYKEINVDTIDVELRRRHASSYFSYRGFNRIYKFFASNAYFELESRFHHMWMLDIANCFDSIYTHSISWAVKNKAYAKQNTAAKNQFCDEFDKQMQASNHSETNGIPIGSEVSRIFAEIIFQRIDLNIEKQLTDKFSLRQSTDYALFRYVDDYILFAKKRENCEHITKVICECIQEFNLYINEQKIKKYDRPFSTEKSLLIAQTQMEIAKLEESLYSRSGNTYAIGTIRENKNALKKQFIGRIKLVCALSNSNYSDASPFLVSVLSKRVINLCAAIRHTIKDEDGTYEYKLRDVITFFLDLIFFFYMVAPQFASSTRLSKTIIILDKFFEEICPAHLDYYRSFVHQHTSLIVSERASGDYRIISFEAINVLLATSDFGDNYLMSPDVIHDFLSDGKESSYFVLVSILYYIKDRPIYRNVAGAVQDLIRNAISFPKLAHESEAIHLFLDSISCPYLPEGFRKDLLSGYLAAFEQNAYDDAAVTRFARIALRYYWFVKWQDLDLIKLLERKELSSKY